MKNYDHYLSLVTKKPVSFSWYNPEGFTDGFYEDPELVDGLSIKDKLLAIIAAYNSIEKAISYKRLIKLTALSRSTLKMLIDEQRKSGLICWQALTDEDGLLCGNGLVFNDWY